MPGGLREVADGVDHHQRALPARGAKSPSDPAVFVAPMGELALEPRLDFVQLIGALFRFFAHAFLRSASSSAPIRRPATNLVTSPARSRPGRAVGTRPRPEWIRSS